MVRVFVVARNRMADVPGGTASTAIAIRGEVQSGFKETLAPTAVGLTSIDYMQLTPLSRTSPFAFPIGSMSSLLGTPGDSGVSIARGRLGSSVTIIWVRPGTPIAAGGTPVSGTRSAFFEAYGRT